MSLMPPCWWCGQPLGFFGRATINVCDMKKTVHRTLWVDCANDYNRFQRDATKNESDRLVARARRVEAIS